MGQPRISFITAVDDKKWYESCCANHLPDGHQYIAVYGASSICQAYNEGIKRAKHKTKCFIHQDVRIIDDKFCEKVFKILEDETVGLIGVIGSKTNANNYKMGWDMGKALIFDDMGILRGRNVEGLYEEAGVVDGMIFVTSWPITFDEETLSSWHYYDMDACFQTREYGKKVVIADIWANHNPSEKQMRKPATVTDLWMGERKKFLKKWGIKDGGL